MGLYIYTIYYIVNYYNIWYADQRGLYNESVIRKVIRVLRGVDITNCAHQHICTEFNTPHYSTDTHVTHMLHTRKTHVTHMLHIYSPLTPNNMINIFPHSQARHHERSGHSRHRRLRCRGRVFSHL